MATSPYILEDRTDLAQLAVDHPEFVKDLHTSRLGIKAGRSALQFCGLAGVTDMRSYVFLPRKSRTGTPDHDLQTARLTMRTLVLFGRQNQNRVGIAPGGEGNMGRLALVADIANDFLKHGIFSERSRHDSRTSGKPNWLKTIIKEPAFVGTDGSVVYPKIRTTRSRDSYDSLLAQTQAAVVLEITHQHGWWIEGLSGCEGELKRYDTPRLTREIWATHLRCLLPELYETRATLLANLLISYLLNDSASHSGETYYGVEDFHTVWEHMLRKVLPGVETGWNSRLPRPAYIRMDGSHDVQDKGFQPDIILRDDDKNLHVVDAKYYNATNIKNAPGHPDIVKQFFYHLAIASVVTGEHVRGCFIFPAKVGEKETFKRVIMIHRNDSTASEFPEIDCHYLDVTEIMKAFTDGRKTNFKLDSA